MATLPPAEEVMKGGCEPTDIEIQFSHTMACDGGAPSDGVGRTLDNASLRLDESILHAWRHVSTSIKLALVIQPVVTDSLLV